MLGEGLRAGLANMGIQTRTVCYLEREAYPAACLAARCEEGSLDAAPVWSDLLTFNGRAWRGAVDCIAAGFPCQDLSLAGRRAGLDGKRSGLFFNILDIADDCGARYLFLENVGGIASATATVVDEAEGELEERAAARVLGELADRGWHAEWLTLSAADVGASHGRERWFCWAWRATMDNASSARRDGARERSATDGSSRQRLSGQGRTDMGHTTSQRRGEARTGDPSPIDAGPGGAGASMVHTTRHGRHQGRTESSREQGRPDAAECCGAVADTSRPGCQGRELGNALHRNRGGQEAHGPVEQLRAALFAPGPADASWRTILDASPWLAPALSIEEQHDAQAAFASAESVLCGTPDGLAARLDFDARAQRLKCCGNGVVALCAAAAAVVLVRRAAEMTEPTQ